MSREAVNIIKDTGLEAGGRRDLLEGLAHYMNEETGLAKVSLDSLTIVTRLSGRQLRNVRRDMLDPAKGHGLLQEVQPMARGRKRANDPSSGLGVYWLNMRRLAPVATAVREARRAIYAGAARAVGKAGLIGKPASYENSFAMIRALRDAVDAEREQATYLEQPVRERELIARVNAIDGQLAVLAAVVEAEIGAEKTAMIAGFPAAKSGNDFRKKGANPATEDANSEMAQVSPPHPPYKDLTPRISIHAHAGAREASDGCEGDGALLSSAVATARLGANARRWLEGVTAVIEGSVLVLHAPGRMTADRLRGELAPDMTRLVRVLSLETYRVEG